MRTLAFCLLLFIPSFCFAQKIKPQKIAKLPSEIKESSGLVVVDSNLFWTMDDSGGRNALFLLNDRAELLKTLLLNNSENHDWEDLTADLTFLFIGDIGNNSNRRKNLHIYKMPKKLAKDSDVFLPQVISFSYPDQKEFPPPPSNWNFDCEAFFHPCDSLYLFSKNLSNPNNGYMKMYRLPDKPGNYTAELIDSFYLNEPVTSADISADGKTVVLLTYFSLWVFKDFQGNNFLEGKFFQFPFKGFTQKEAVCFANDHELFITDERHFGKGGKLYKIDLNSLDCSHPTEKIKSNWSKRAIYNFFNNPKVKYKKIMKREAPQ